MSSILSIESQWWGTIPYVAICYDFLYNITEYNHPYMRSLVYTTRGVLILRAF